MFSVLLSLLLGLHVPFMTPSKVDIPSNQRISGVVLSAGPAADAQGQLKAMEKLAAEVEADSSIAGRSMWKWTCYQARLL